MKGWEHLKFWEHGYEAVCGNVFDASNYDETNVLPRQEDRFKAFHLTPFESVKCVILGQDPYPTPGHAMGLAFSVHPHVRPLPRSLTNIFREYVSDTDYPFPRFGDLTPWAKEGVLLLNTCLTVEAGKPGSHAGVGWEKLTYEVVRSLDDLGTVVFCLWGKYAQEFRGACPRSHVVCTSHPSPFSASKGFLGSKPFTQVNEWRVGNGHSPVNWRLP